jgi:N-acetylglucosaminyl-diphospho-decaprenol L-rhamnosyltransferase
MPPKATCAVLVLNWNGRTHLEHLLPSLRAAREAHGQPLPIVVVDNQSTTDDVGWLRATYPDVDVHVAERNDYLFSLNAVVAARREDVIVVLNNDMRVEPSFVAPLLAHFADPNVFAVSASVHEWDGHSPQIGPRRIRFDRFWLTHWFELGASEPCYTAEAGGGCSAYRRSYFSELGGFDPLYSPGYWEDFDLSYRAWRRGWTSVFEPRSVIYHRAGATLGGTLSDWRRDCLLERNRTLFLLKNVGDWRFAAGVLRRLPYRLLYNATRGNRAAARGMLAAIPRIGRAIRGRRSLGAARLSPADIVAHVSGPLRRPSPALDAVT